MYGAAPEMASPLLADESAPLVVREERKGSHVQMAWAHVSSKLTASTVL